MATEQISMTAKEIREKYQLDFRPRRMEERYTDEELEGINLYSIKVRDLFEAKRKGDVKLVGEMVGITGDYAEKSLGKSDSKYHTEVVDALEAIIESRRKLLQRKKQPKAHE